MARNTAWGENGLRGELANTVEPAAVAAGEPIDPRPEGADSVRLGKRVVGGRGDPGRTHPRRLQNEEDVTDNADRDE